MNLLAESYQANSWKRQLAVQLQHRIFIRSSARTTAAVTHIPIFRTRHVPLLLPSQAFRLPKG